jgi:hypothetical protein
MIMPSHIYNVIVGGSSVGMTFNHNEAINWVSRSMSNMDKQIVKVPYTVSEQDWLKAQRLS